MELLFETAPIFLFGFMIALPAALPTMTRPVLVAVVTALAILGLLFCRNSTLFLDPQLWAEDLDVYFAQDRLFGAGAILRPHNGFVQFICRIVAWLAGFADPAHVPRIYAASFIASVLATAATVYTSPAFGGPSKVLAALSVVAVPVNSEVFLSMSYIPWVIGPIVGLALYERPNTLRRAAILLGASLIVALSSPFMIIAMPIAGWKAFEERSRFSVGLLCIAFGSALFHLGPISARFLSGVPHSGLDRKLDALVSPLYRWIIGPSNLPLSLCVIIAMVTLIVAFWYFLTARPINVRAYVSFMGFGALLLVISCASLSGAGQANQYGGGARYFYIPTLLLIWTFVATGRERPGTNAVAAFSTILLSTTFASHANQNAVFFTKSEWPQVALCLRDEPECIVEALPIGLGRRRIPTDHQLKSLDAQEKMAFQIHVQ